jgi:hypothetical protein
VAQVAAVAPGVEDPVVDLIVLLTRPTWVHDRVYDARHPDLGLGILG